MEMGQRVSQTDEDATLPRKERKRDIVQSKLGGELITVTRSQIGWTFNWVCKLHLSAKH